jgi:6-phosphogluconolactonase (cycloisomerase 2 family)
LPTAAIGSPFSIGAPHPTDIVTHPTTGDYLYESDDTTDSVWGWSINHGTAALTPLPGSPFTVRSNPGKMAIDPTGAYLYITHTAQDIVELVRINPATGVLTPTGLTYSTGPQPKGVAVDPSGGFVCVANSGGPSISVYSLNTATGGILDFVDTYSTMRSDPEDILMTGTY